MAGRPCDLIDEACRTRVPRRHNPRRTSGVEVSGRRGACDPAAGITHTACSGLDLTVATTIADATGFLYTGPDAIQTGVAAGTIDVRRAAVIRGRVRATDGSPLAGVHVEVQGHPEYGMTRTFADGMFTMAVNGGGALVVSYHGDGFLPVARQVEVPWQDYARAADVVMTPYDGHWGPRPPHRRGWNYT